MVPGAYFLLVRNLAVGLLCLVSLVRGTYSGAIEIYQTVSELVFPETGLPALGSSGETDSQNPSRCVRLQDASCSCVI